MFVEINYDKRFTDLWGRLQRKYPYELFNLEGVGEQLDLNLFSRKFFTSTVMADSSIDANANVDDVSVIAYNTELPKPYFKLNSYFVLWDMLRKLYLEEVANEIVERQLVGDIYIHDFHGIASGLSYCFNYSTYDVMIKGLPMIKKIKSIPPKYLFSFKSQLEQFTVIASNSTLGATGLADIFIVMSYYVKNILRDKRDSHFSFLSEQDCWNYVRENLVSFIYTINQPMRAHQAPFTNVSVYDRYFLDKLSSDYIFPDGSTPDSDIVMKIQELFLDIMREEMKRTAITFPVVSACISVDEDGNVRDEEFVRMIAEKNIKYGFNNIFHGKTSVLSSCCRLRSDSDNEYFNSFGAGTTKIGSLGVCTINFPRLAIKSCGSREKFFEGLEHLIEVCSMVNNAKREIVRKRIKNGNLPLYTYGFAELGKQYSTVGVNGINECVELMGMNILEEDGQRFVLDIMDVINSENNKYQEIYKAPHNCEQVPGESMSHKSAEKDKLLGYQNKYDLYSNQFIPLTTNADILDRLKIQGLFDRHFSGGASCHINLETSLDNSETMVNLIKAAAKMGVIFYSFNMNIQECTNGHFISGKRINCAICNSAIVNDYTRVVGFLVNTKNWSRVRREKDYPDRQWYRL